MVEDFPRVRLCVRRPIIWWLICVPAPPYYVWARFTSATSGASTIIFEPTHFECHKGLERISSCTIFGNFSASRDFATRIISPRVRIVVRAYSLTLLFPALIHACNGILPGRYQNLHSQLSGTDRVSARCQFRLPTPPSSLSSVERYFS